MIKIKQLVEELKIQVQKSRPNIRYKAIMDTISKLEHEILYFEGIPQCNAELDKTSIKIESKNISIEEETVITSPTKTPKTKK